MQYITNELEISVFYIFIFEQILQNNLKTLEYYWLSKALQIQLTMQVRNPHMTTIYFYFELL